MIKPNVSLEERAQLLEGAKDFANYVTSNYPQVNQKGQLNYYLAGSLSMILLSQVEYFDLLDPLKLPEIAITHQLQIKPELSDKLKNFARKIGDLDYVETSAYKEAKSLIPVCYVDPEGYRKGIKGFLFKGGGGPSFDELPDSARNVLSEAKSGHKVMCDPVGMYSESKVARITLDEKEYFINEPKSFIGYKFLNLLQKFYSKPESLKRDFSILYSVISQIYSEEELVESTHNILEVFESHMEEVFKSQFEPKIGKETRFLSAKLSGKRDSESKCLKLFLDKLKKYDSGHNGIMKRE